MIDNTSIDIYGKNSIMNLLLRKILTAKRIYKEGGIVSLKRHIIRILKRLNHQSSFYEINRCVNEELDRSYLEIARTLANAVAYVHEMGVKGEIAEFGTMSGRSAVALATATSYYHTINMKDPRGLKSLHLFDSFKGLPEARFDIDKFSQHVSSGIWAKGTCIGLTKKNLSKLISKYINQNKFQIYPGWFKDTVPSLNSEICFSLIHIDGDLYESAIDVLDSLFARDKVSKGAMILFDDWNCNEADPGLGEKKAFQEICEKYSVNYSDEGSYGKSSHKFIIHEYRV